MSIALATINAPELLAGGGWGTTVLAVVALLAAACAVFAVASVLFGFLIAPRIGRPLAYHGWVGV
ncbi:MAG: hypothetical protein JNK53_01285, partial [Phycisphaerae bacterium]|nr:hypothetical protein [Phycisphaerae bacterium]